jgi:hypothetical protein
VRAYLPVPYPGGALKETKQETNRIEKKILQEKAVEATKQKEEKN